MIINPIIPIWIMTIICIVLIILIVYRKKENIKKLNKEKRLTLKQKANITVKILIVILLFIINLRFMVPNGESLAINADVSVLFVIDTSVSMKALDYNGNMERFEGVINDCCYIVDELSSCRFSIITFGDTAQKTIPFTNDTDMVQSELKSISLEDDFYAEGSSMNLPKDIIEKTLKEEKKRREKNTKFIVFFVSDGEITKQGENLESFDNIKQYVSDGAVLGYGTQNGGKMVSSTYEDKPNSPYYYIYYYDNNYNNVTALSKIDEKNLKQIAEDIGVDYIHMSKTSNVDYKLDEIKVEISKTQTNEDKISAYKDIYYYFAIPLVGLLLLDFIIQKRRM